MAAPSFSAFNFGLIGILLPYSIGPCQPIFTGLKSLRVSFPPVEPPENRPGLRLGPGILHQPAHAPGGTLPLVSGVAVGTESDSGYALLNPEASGRTETPPSGLYDFLEVFAMNELMI